MSLPLWVSIALWVDLVAAVLSVVLSIIKTGEPRTPWPRGGVLVAVVVCNGWLALALWRVLHP